MHFQRFTICEYILFGNYIQQKRIYYCFSRSMPPTFPYNSANKHRYGNCIMQLMVSTDIALRILIYLGHNNKTATIQDASDDLAISKTHLMKVVMTLVSAGYLASDRGRNGGVRLGMMARDISVGDVVRLMETNLALVVCMKEDAAPDVCPLLPRCRLKKLFVKAQETFFATLDQSTLADLLA